MILKSHCTIYFICLIRSVIIKNSRPSATLVLLIILSSSGLKYLKHDCKHVWFQNDGIKAFLTPSPLKNYPLNNTENKEHKFHLP